MHECWTNDKIENTNQNLKSVKTASKKVCLFNCGFLSHLRIFHSYGDVTIASEGLQILTYARHLCPLSSEDSNGHFEGPVTLTPIAERSAVELSLPVFTT